jgi:hypothetical protein
MMIKSFASLTRTPITSAKFVFVFVILAQATCAKLRPLSRCYASINLLILYLGITACSEQKSSVQADAEFRGLVYKESMMILLVIEKALKLDMEDSELIQMFEILEESVQGKITGSFEDYSFILVPLQSGGKIRIIAICVPKEEGCGYEAIYGPDQNLLSNVNFETES